LLTAQLTPETTVSITTLAKYKSTLNLPLQLVYEGASFPNLKVSSLRMRPFVASSYQQWRELQGTMREQNKLLAFTLLESQPTEAIIA